MTIFLYNSFEDDTKSAHENKPQRVVNWELRIFSWFDILLFSVCWVNLLPYAKNVPPSINTFILWKGRRGQVRMCSTGNLHHSWQWENPCITEIHPAPMCEMYLQSSMSSSQVLSTQHQAGREAGWLAGGSQPITMVTDERRMCAAKCSILAFWSLETDARCPLNHRKGGAFHLETSVQ